MTSTSSLVDTEPAYFPQGIGPVYEYEIALDGASGVVTVRTPTAGKRIWVVGILEAEGNTGNLILISNPASPSKTKTLELAANQAIYDKASGGYIFSTKTSEALGINSTMAISSLTLRVVEAESFYIR